MVVDHLQLFFRQGPLIKLAMTFDQSAAEQLAAEAAHAMQQVGGPWNFSRFYKGWIDYI